MSLFNKRKINDDGTIISDDMITEKEGYDATLYMLYALWRDKGSVQLTDILKGGEYWLGESKPSDLVFWEYWLKAVQKVKKQGPPPLKFSGESWD